MAGRQQPCLHYGEWTGHHRGLRPGLRLRFSPRRRIVPLRAGGQPVGLTARRKGRAYASERRDYGRYSEVTNHINRKPGNCEAGISENCVLGSKVMGQTGCRLFGLPLASSLWHPRNRMREIFKYDLWGGRRVTGAFTRNLTSIPLALHRGR